MSRVRNDSRTWPRALCMVDDAAALGGRDAGGVLAAVLQKQEGVVDLLVGGPTAHHSDDSAHGCCLLRLVVSALCRSASCRLPAQRAGGPRRNPRGARRRRRRPWRPARSGRPDARRRGRRPPARSAMPSRERADAAASALSAATTARNPMPRFQVPSVEVEVEVAEVGEHAEHRGRRPRRAVELDPRALGQHAREVGGDAAAGDVAERVHAASPWSAIRRSSGRV